MIQYIKSMCGECMLAFDRWMFGLVYIVTTLSVGSYYHIRAILSYQCLKDKKSFNQDIEDLLEKGDEAFDCFLNRATLIIPDEQRRYILYGNNYG